MGGQNKKSPGYTIVEVMIVLAVSGIMFLIAAAFISGKQETTSFSEGVNDMASNLQNTIEQVTDGQYSDVPITCSANNGGPPQISASQSGNQGTNAPCVFIGKFLHFDMAGSSASNYEVFSLVSNRLDATGSSVSSYFAPTVNAYPVPVVDTSSIPYPLDLTTQETSSQNLDIGWVHINGGSSKAYGFGFLQSLGALLAGGATGGGAQTVSLVYAPALTSAQNEAGAIHALTSSPGNPSLAQANSATICLTDQTQSATIDVGATSNNPLAVNVTFLSSANCP